MLNRVISTLITALAMFALLQISTTINAQTPQWSEPKPINSYAFSDESPVNESDPQVANDGGDNWVAMWRNYYDRHLIFGRSQDAGATWGPSYVNTSVTTTVGQVHEYLDNASHLYAGDGKWVAAWTVDLDDFYGPDSSRVYSAWSANFGQTWSTSMRLDPGGDTTQPLQTAGEIDLASDGEGNVLGTFVAKSSGTAITDILLVRSTDYGQTWSAPERLPVDIGGARDSVSARIAYAGDDGWVVVYYVSSQVGGVGSPDYVKKYSAITSADLGETWQSSGQIHQDYTLGGVYEVHARDGAIVVAAFSTGINSGYFVLVSYDKGLTFTRPVWVERQVNESSRPVISISADASGTWGLAVRQPYSNIPASIYMSTDPATSWTKSAVLTSGTVMGLDIAGGKPGEFVTVLERDNISTPIPGTDFDIASIRSTNSGTTWTDPLLVNDTANTDSIQVNDVDVDLESGGNSLLAAWTADDTRYGGASGTMLSHSHFKGLSWDDATEVTRISSAPDLVYVGGPNWIIVWPGVPGQISYSYDNGQNWTARVSFDGNLIASNNSGILLRARNSTHITRSLDGGHTWLPPSQLQPISLSHIIYTGGSSWLAVGTSGAVLTSIDNGDTWTTHAGPTFTVQGVAAGRSGVVVATGSSNLAGPNTAELTLNTFVSRSSDGGATWSPQVLVHSQTRSGSAISSDFRGMPTALWVGGDQWAIFPKNIFAYRTQPLDINHIRNMDIFFVQSTDGGTTWGVPELILPITGFDFPTGTDYAVLANVLTVAYTAYVPEFTGYDYDIFHINLNLGARAAATDWTLYE